MHFTFRLMDEAAARVLHTWRYEEPYAIYSMASDDPDALPDLSEMLDPRSPYYAVYDEQGEIVGHFCFGTSALAWDSPEPGIYVSEDKTVAIGLGLRPDLTGKGFGLAFVEAGLDFARTTFDPASFMLIVYTWNERAIRIYERAGFQRVRVVPVSNMYGNQEFLEMRRMA